MKSTVIALIMTLLCTTAQACGNSSDTPGTPQPPAKPGTPSYMNPVIHADAPDPSVIRADDGRFYLYTTGGGYAIYSSANLATLAIAFTSFFLISNSASRIVITSVLSPT